jgi:hypothetical protein
VLQGVELTCPPPPIPDRALNMLGQQKQTNPIWIIWERGELYRKREDFFFVVWDFWGDDSSY